MVQGVWEPGVPALLLQEAEARTRIDVPEIPGGKASEGPREAGRTPAPGKEGGVRGRISNCCAILGKFCQAGRESLAKVTC